MRGRTSPRSARRGCRGSRDPGTSMSSLDERQRLKRDAPRFERGEREAVIADRFAAFGVLLACTLANAGEATRIRDECRRRSAANRSRETRRAPRASRGAASAEMPDRVRLDRVLRLPPEGVPRHAEREAPARALSGPPRSGGSPGSRSMPTNAAPSSTGGDPVVPLPTKRIEHDAARRSDQPYEVTHERDRLQRRVSSSGRAPANDAPERRLFRHARTWARVR